MKLNYPTTHCVTPDTLTAIRRRHPLALEAVAYAPGRFEIGHGMRQGVFPGLRICAQQAENLFRCDVQYCEAMIRSAADFPISEALYQALVSLFFDVGPKTRVVDFMVATARQQGERAYFSLLPSNAHWSRFGQDIGRAARFYEAKQAH